MARRGTPLPWATREQIARLIREGLSRRKVAKELGLDNRTAYKYARLVRAGD